MEVKSHLFEIMQFCFLHSVLLFLYLTVLLKPNFLKKWKNTRFSHGLSHVLDKCKWRRVCDVTVSVLVYLCNWVDTLSLFLSVLWLCSFCVCCVCLIPDILIYLLLLLYIQSCLYFFFFFFFTFSQQFSIFPKHIFSFLQNTSEFSDRSEKETHRQMHQ